MYTSAMVVKKIESALKNVFEIDDQALVETMIQGDEYTVGVLGTEDPQVLPVIQIIPIDRILRFRVKVRRRRLEAHLSGSIERRTYQESSEHRSSRT